MPTKKSAKRAPKKAAPKNRAPQRTVLEERTFNLPPGYKESPDMPGVAMSPKYQDWLKSLIEGVAADANNADLSPNAKALADELAIVHLPEATFGERKVAEPTRFEIKQAGRLAAYLDQRGVTINPDKAIIQWVPTPNAGPGDMGIHITRNDDGTWPTPDPEDFYDIDKLIVTQSQTGWIAAHPCGVKAESPSKSAAHAAAVAQLVEKIEAAKAQTQEVDQ